MDNEKLLESELADKVQLGMGELFQVLQTGTHTEGAEEYWAFLEVQPDTVFTELIFTPNRSVFPPVAVTKFNGITIQGVLLIPPVYNQISGHWSKVVISAGQVNCYGKEPIG